MYVWQRWMADEFRAAGLVVHEVENWRNRGRPATVGGYNPTAGLLDHHTGSTTSPSNPHPTLKTLIQGRPDLPGPLAPWSVDHNGEVWVIAAGRCNHAGRTDIRFAGVGIGADGNFYFMGDEVDTNGTQALSAKQRRSLTVTNAIYLKHMRNRLETLGRHADITKRKWDIGSISTAAIRTDVTTYNQEDDMTPEDLRQIKDAIAAEGEATRKMLQGLVGDVVPSDPALWGDPPENTNVYARTALSRLLAGVAELTGKDQSQP